MSAPINVVELMRDDAREAHFERERVLGSNAAREADAESDQARAYVAELVAADCEFDAAHAAYAVAKTGKPRNDAWGRVLAARSRRAAALAQFKVTP